MQTSRKPLESKGDHTLLILVPESAGSSLLVQHPVPDKLEIQCRIVVDQLLSDHKWRLLDRDELVRRTLDHLQAALADRVESAVIGAYCVALHSACSGAEGLLRQEIAYGELARYLYGLIAMRFADLRPDVREDVAQSTLERIFKSFDRCREPVAFLAFAAQHLLDAVRMARRQEYRPVESFEQVVGADEDSPGDALPDARPQPIEHLLIAEQRATIDCFLQEFVTDHPRALQQVAILRMTWLDDMDDPAISRRLGISLGSVYTARSRVIKTIQSEPKWQARARALGLLFDEV
jgi:RNA polymerase sigma factor (sigma-70 family)